MKTFEEYMNLKVIKDILRSMAKGAVNQANINAQELQSVKIYIPDMGLQNQFVAFIEQTDKSKFQKKRQYRLIIIKMYSIQEGGSYENQF